MQSFLDGACGMRAASYAPGLGTCAPRVHPISLRPPYLYRPPPSRRYPHYESPPNPSFSDFKPFGGWTAPTIKQYGDGTVPPGHFCGVNLDNNWRP